jgi:hypothetical protein
MRYAKESSKSLMLYDNSLPSFAEPGVICMDEHYFVYREMGATSKDEVLNNCKNKQRFV